MFARLPTSARHDRAPCGWTGSGVGSLRSFRVLTAGDLLFGQRAHVLAVVAVRACNHLGLFGDAAARRRRWPLYHIWVLTSAAGFLTHYFFVFPWLAIVGYLLIRPARLKRHQLALCVLATALLILPWYIRVPESLAGWRITKDWLKSRPLHFSRLVALRDNVLQFFYGHDRRLWLGRRVWNMPPFLLFAAIAVLMLWKMPERIFARGRLLLVLIFLAGCMGPFVFDRLQHTYTIGLPRYSNNRPARSLSTGRCRALFLTASG